MIKLKSGVRAGFFITPVQSQKIKIMIHRLLNHIPKRRNTYHKTVVGGVRG